MQAQACRAARHPDTPFKSWGAMWCCWWGWEHPSQVPFLPGARQLCAAAPHPSPCAKWDQSHRESYGRGKGRGADCQGGYLEGRADPKPVLSPAPHTPPLQQGDAGEGVGGWELQWCRAPLSLSCRCTEVGTASGCLKGLLYMLLLHKLERDSALN